MTDKVMPENNELPREAGSERIVWDFDIPLLTNPFILLDFAKLLVITFAIMSALFMLIGIVQGVDEFLELLPLIPMFAICVLAVGVLMVLVMLAFYRNRFPCRFTVDRKGVGYEVTPLQRKMNTVVIILGALARRPGVVGSGLLARAQESDFFSWTDIHRADLYPRRRVVCIRNSWRTLLRVYCMPENYDAVAAMALDGVKRTAAARGRNVARGREFRLVMLKRMAWWPLILLSAILSTAQPLLEGRFGSIWATAAILALGAIFAGPARRLMGILALLVTTATIIVTVANGLKVTSYAGGYIHWTGFEAATDHGDLLFFTLGSLGLLTLLALSLRNTIIGRADCATPSP